MEPCRDKDPNPGFLEYVKESAHKCGALLIFDEITTGWRFNFGGAHLKLGTNPDIAVFAKALGNGHPIGAIIGTKEAMEGANTSFISSTYWTESVGPVAALATIKKMRQVNLPLHIEKIGRKVLNYWKESAARYNLTVDADDCYPCLAHFKFKHSMGEELKTLYIQLMLERGFLAGTGIYPTLAHNDEIISLYGAAIDEVFEVIASAIEQGNVKEKLKGPIAHSGFKRLL
jgi:glutamate-1-semialdehyde 2,1-aminomutase